MAKQPLFFHVRNEDGQATFAVQSFDDRNFSVGYAVTHKGDHFCKKTGRKIALERSSYILSNPTKNASRTVTEDKTLLPHIIRKTIDEVVLRSAELLKLESKKLCVVTWTDTRLPGGLLQMEVENKIEK